MQIQSIHTIETVQLFLKGLDLAICDNRDGYRIDFKSEKERQL